MLEKLSATKNNNKENSILSMIEDADHKMLKDGFCLEIVGYLKCSR